MSDPFDKLLNATPSEIAAIMALGNRHSSIWRPEELAAIFHEQLAAPLVVDISGLAPGAAAKLRLITETGGLPLKSYKDLLGHSHPPVDLLVIVKGFAKFSGSCSGSLPYEVASALYYLTIAVALVRCDQLITKLTKAELQSGFGRVLKAVWIDEPWRQVVAQAAECLQQR